MGKKENLPPKPVMHFPKEREIFDQGCTLIEGKEIKTTVDLSELPSVSAYPDEKHTGSKNEKDQKVIWRFIEMTTGFKFQTQSIAKEIKTILESKNVGLKLSEEESINLTKNIDEIANSTKKDMIMQIQRIVDNEESKAIICQNKNYISENVKNLLSTPETVAESISKAKELWQELYFEELNDGRLDSLVDFLNDKTLKKTNASFGVYGKKSGKKPYNEKLKAIYSLLNKAPAFGKNNDSEEARKVCRLLKLVDASMESKKHELAMLKKDADEFENILFGNNIKWLENSPESTIEELENEIKTTILEINKISKLSKKKTSSSKEKDEIKIQELQSRSLEIQTEIEALKLKKAKKQTCPTKKESYLNFQKNKYWIESRLKNENDLIFKIARESGFSAHNISKTKDLEEAEKVKDEIGFRVEVNSTEKLKGLMKSIIIKVKKNLSKHQIYNLELIDTNLLSISDNQDEELSPELLKMLKELNQILPINFKQRKKKKGSHENFRNIKILGKFEIEGRKRTFEIQFVLVGNENETRLSHHAVFRAKQNLMLIDRLDGYIREGLVLRHAKNAAIASFEEDPKEFKEEFAEWQEAIKEHIFNDHLELILPEEAGFSSPKYYRFITGKKK